MGFGAKAINKNGATTTTTDTTSNKSIFFPTASGNDGEPIEYTFRLFPDESNEQEIVFKEYAGAVMVNGKSTFRSCIVDSDNIFDNASRVRKAEIDAMEISAEAKKELYKELKWCSNRFAVNVVNKTESLPDGTANPDFGKVQIFKGSWKRMKEKTDEQVNKEMDAAPKNDPGYTVLPFFVDDNVLYGKLLSVINTVRVPSATNKKGVTLRIDQHDIILKCYGQGQFGKKYSVRGGYDQEPLSDEMLNQPRWNIEDWVTRSGIWSNEALEELKNGADYYETAKKYSIALWPELSASVVVAVEEEEELFKD